MGKKILFKKNLPILAISINLVFFLIMCLTILTICACTGSAESNQLFEDKWQQNWAENCSSAYMKVNISADISITENKSSSVDYVSANLSFFPKNTVFQKSIITTESYAEKSDCCIFFRWDEPFEKKIHYEVNADVFSNKAITKIKENVNFPITELPEAESEYLKKTENINFDREIAEKASEIVEGSDNLFEAVSVLGFWVNNNVEYDLKYASEIKDAKWVFENRKGTCDEISSLFIAMCRSIGIPARYVAGVAYSNLPEMLGFGSHGWAEVYFPKYGWIAFDVTYGQFGFTDASHIKFFASEDTEIAPVRYGWKGYDLGLNATELSIQTELQSITPDIPLVRINLQALEQYIDIESFNLIIAEVYNPNDFYVAVPVRISDNEGLQLFSEKTQYVYLEPQETKILFWIVKTEKLDRNFVYTIPITVYSGISSSTVNMIAATKSSSLNYEYVVAEMQKRNVEKKEEQYVHIVFKCSKNKFYVNESGLSNCTVKNAGNTLLKNLEVCFGNDCRKTEFSIMEERVFEISFNTSSIGEKRARVGISNENLAMVSKFDYEVIERPVIEISNLTYPQVVSPEKNFNINFTIKRVSGIIKSANIMIIPSYLADNASIGELEEKLPVSIEINPKNLRPGKNSVEIKIEFYDKFGEKYPKTERVDIDVKRNFLHSVEFTLYRIEDFINMFIDKIFSRQ